MKKNNFWQKLNKTSLAHSRPILALAPMAGITDSAFRQICAENGADVVYSEMVSADALFFDSKVTKKMLEHNKKEHFLVIQLFGKDPDKFAKAARIVQESGADGIDVNFGCPANKVVKHGGGVSLMRDLNKCYEIIRAVIENTELPVSIKVRTKIKSEDKKNEITVFELFEKIKDLPIAAVMIHGRSYEQGFAGDVDFEAIKKTNEILKSYNPDISVLGNGGIYAPEDAKEMIDKTKVDGIGIARGVYGNPWLFDQIKEFYKRGVYKKPNFSQIKKQAFRHAELLLDIKPTKGIYEIRKHLSWYVKGVKNAAEYRKQLVRVKDLSEIKEILDSIWK